ncbi:MAG TPA: hypothetical protein DCE41_29265 [Cytophagales bacterium]|nr:hypothetical protein [Cytophagales bacterium]HAA18029.1 hypothetical protein [Cytophagales bacterium]HAP63063.1 hypothetical protein [Cytophagales bacterium]
MTWIKGFIGVVAVLVALVGCGLKAGQYEKAVNTSVSEKMSGVSLVAPPRPMSIDDMRSINRVNAGWVSVIPFGFSRAGQGNLSYNTSGQWWGERKEGAQKQIEFAHSLGKKVLLKPHVWVMGQGWPGDYILDKETEWQKWERDYKAFILDYAALAESTGVEMLCVGTEFRQVVKIRPQFWEQLVPEIREVYSGLLTYAANWDNYENVTFWGQLDYIGIDAYFPITQDLSNPNADELDEGWESIINNLKEYSQRQGRPILFTEYGFRSIDFCAAGHYNVPETQIRPNQQAQADAYASFFRTIWQESWFAGGFLWKWFTDGDSHGRRDTGFTPQEKMAEEVIAKHYK